MQNFFSLMREVLFLYQSENFTNLSFPELNLLKEFLEGFSLSGKI
jgi:hypothetical protein